MNGLRVVLGFALAGTGCGSFVLAALSGPRTALATAAALAVVLVLLALKSRRSSRRVPAGWRVGHSSADRAGGAVARFRRRRGAGRVPGRALAVVRPGVIRQLVGEGKTVFVDVTAAWCWTCKVNEAAVLDREPVAHGCSGRMWWRCAATGPGPIRG